MKQDVVARFARMALDLVEKHSGSAADMDQHYKDLLRLRRYLKQVSGQPDF